MSVIHRFFEPTKGMEPCLPSAYLKMRHYRNFADSISDIDHHSFYIIDYYKRTFDYVSDNPLFLCGYSACEVKNLGFDYYEMVIPPEDLKMVLEISDNAFKFFYDLPINSRTKCSISYDFRMIQSDGMLLLINHKVKPLLLTRQGFLWMAFCEVSVSVNKHPGNVIITMKDENVKYEYSFASHKFKLCENLPLTTRERDVFSLLAKGLTVNKIASQLYVEPNTIKYHKKNIFKKLGLKSRIQLMQLGNGRETGS